MTNFLLKIFIKEYKNDNDISNPAIRKKFGILSGTIGIICNVILFFAKLFVGMITSSIAVIADAFNNLNDAGASIVTLACFKIAGSPADKEHPFGHGRVEYISGLILSVVIILTGVSFAKSSIEKIISPEPTLFDIKSIVILVLSLLLKLWMGLFSKKLSEILNSSAMKAASWDSFSDVAATLAVIVSMLFTKFTGLYVDAYAGILVSLFIIITGIGMIKETLGPLLGQAPDPDMVSEIHKIVLSYKEIVGIHELMIHNYGPGKSIISLHAEMPADINIIYLHEIIDEVEDKLKAKFNCQAVIHLDPIVTKDDRLNALKDKISEVVKIIHQSSKIYDLRIIPTKQHRPTIIFGLSVPFDIKKPDSEIRKSLAAALNAIDDSFEYRICINRESCEVNLSKEML